MIGERIKHFRELKKQTRVWLAQELGVDPSQINRIENNKTELTVTRLFEIASLLKVNVMDLLNEKHQNIYHSKILEKYGPIESSFIIYVLS